eukprot:TRINITY_DN2386_c0_g1_i1.p1 TRINITY_DN2386_c0_g1~~TRINITY_DN2386_c0_g1_i1.p1  ORF type:complete len:53 (+),score=7.12 TRINITY_DN2386_c0_g1_i1:46-204(+)
MGELQKPKLVIFWSISQKMMSNRMFYRSVDWVLRFDQPKQKGKRVKVKGKEK